MRIRIAIATVVAVLAAVIVPAAAAPPTNDDFGSATPLTEGIETRLSTVDATAQAAEVNCGDDNSAWFSFTAPSDGEYYAYATGSDYDSTVGKSNSLTDIVRCNNNAQDSVDGIVTLGLLSTGDTTFVNVTADSSGYVGTGSVGVAEVVDAADDFADAVDLEVRPGATSAVLALDIPTHTAETGEPTACGAITLDTRSSWVDFVAPSSGSWMFEAKTTDPVDIGVYQGDAVDDLTLLNCATDDGRAVLVDVTEGETYRIRIGAAVAPPAVVRAQPATVRSTAELVDANGSGASTAVGRVSDLAFVDGEPFIAYYDQSQSELRWAARAAGVWTDGLIDADGDGTSTDVGRNLSVAVLDNGEPAVAYYDATNAELRYATRSVGVWTDVLVDENGDGTSTDVGEDPAMIVLANGDPAIAYFDSDNGEGRLATQSGGSWTDELIDADGDGSSTSTGETPAIVQFANGDLGVAYSDAANQELRFARRVGASWTDETVWVDPNGDTNPAVAGIVVDRGGNAIIAANNNRGSHVVADHNGVGWDITHSHAERGMAEVGGTCTRPALLIDPDDHLFIVWSDCRETFAMGALVRNGAGAWSSQELFAATYDVDSIDNRGTIGVDSTDDFGVGWTPDGRLATTFVLDSDDRLFYAEDALVAEAGPAAGGPGERSADLDGSGSTDGFGSIVSYAWSGAPAGCTIIGGTTASASIRCNAATSGTVSLTVTDSDGLTHADTTSFTVAESCDPAPDPFTDVAGSFARADITCIYNLGVTTGSGPTTYAPTATVTREQMAAFLARLYEAATGTAAPVVSTPLTDIGGSFAAADIARIYGLGITTGNTPTTYDPAGTVSREQMAAFLARLYAAIEGSPAPVVVTPLTDIAGSFASADIRRIYGLGITTGNTPTTYDPAGTVSREQMAAFLARLFLAT